MTNRKELTERQKLVYDSIVDYQMQHGYAPSIRELCVICNLAWALVVVPALFFYFEVQCHCTFGAKSTRFGERLITSRSVE